MESINYADKKAHINNTILVPIILCFVSMHPSSSSILPVHPPQEGNSMVSRLLCAMEQRTKENNLPRKLEDGVVGIEYLHLSERKVDHSLTAIRDSTSLGLLNYGILEDLKFGTHIIFFPFPTGFSLGVLSTWDVAFSYTKQRNLRRGFR